MIARFHDWTHSRRTARRLGAGRRRTVTGALHARRAIVTLVAALAGCAGEGWPCDPNAEGPDVLPVAYFGLFDTNGIRICPRSSPRNNPDDGPRYSVGRAGVEATTQTGIVNQSLHTRLTPDQLSFDLLDDGPCNLTRSWSSDALGVFAFPECPDAVDLHYTMEVPGCVPQTGVFTRDRFEHPAAAQPEYRIPVFLDCDDTVARWPEGAPRPEF